MTESDHENLINKYGELEKTCLKLFEENEQYKGKTFITFLYNIRTYEFL
jgi:hypothetical protein